MSFHFKLLLGVSMLAFATSPLLAKEAKQKTGARPPHQVSGELNLLKNVDLTDVQKQQVKELEAKYVPMFHQLRDKMHSVLTDDQRTARDKARQQARAEGKKGREMHSAIEAAAPLTDAQRATQKEVNREIKSAHQEMHGALVALLTDSQKEQLPKPHERRKKS